ncbi:MAG: VWA domain-containing protein, partial [Acidobacteriales bacterium]|nr:VWA domain-containing protein [Terriglobales bacterium]
MALALGQAVAQGSSCETRTVLVPIVNNQWQTLTNLKAANFLVEGQHGKIEVISAQPHTAPRRIILLLDTSGSMQPRKLEIARSLALALASSAEQHTEVSVYTFSDKLADFLGSSKDLQGLSRALHLVSVA